MPSTPLICCSRGEATVSAITVGFAPGYEVRTTTVGGTTSGYSLNGSRRYASAPITKIMIETTPAKMGRSIKKFEIFISASCHRCSPAEPGFSASPFAGVAPARSEEHTSELQSRLHLVCRLLL